MPIETLAAAGEQYEPRQRVAQMLMELREALDQPA